MISDIQAGITHRLRPLLCPFNELVEQVPRGASVLDVGCGSGVFLGMLAESGRIRSGYGVDRSIATIRDAQKIAAKNGWAAILQFQKSTSLEEIADENYDVVSVIDVMHHVTESEQEKFFAEAAGKLRPGGIFIYKDISARHMVWRWCNTLHDLLKARELVHYCSEERLADAAKKAGLQRRTGYLVRKLWYMHVVEIFNKPVLGVSAVR